MDDYNVKITISDLQINRETWSATVGVIVKYIPITENVEGKSVKGIPETWKRAYSYSLKEFLPLEKFLDTVREHVLRDIMIEQNVRELIAIKGKSIKLFKNK